MKKAHTHTHTQIDSTSKFCMPTGCLCVMLHLLCAFDTRLTGERKKLSQIDTYYLFGVEIKNVICMLNSRATSVRVCVCTGYLSYGKFPKRLYVYKMVILYLDRTGETSKQILLERR